MTQAAVAFFSTAGKGRSSQNFSFLALSSSSEMRLPEAERISLGLPAPRLTGLQVVKWSGVHAQLPIMQTMDQEQHGTMHAWARRSEHRLNVQLLGRIGVPPSALSQEAVCEGSGAELSKAGEMSLLE